MTAAFQWVQKDAETGTTRQLIQELHQTMCQDFQTPEHPKLAFHFGCPRSLVEVADSHYLSTIVFSSVVLNGVQMGLQTDYSGPEWAVLFTALDQIFTSVFAFEMIVKVAAHRSAYFASKWNCFDFILTWLSIFDVWVAMALGSGGNLKMLAVLRILRIFRVVRLLRMLHGLRELALIVAGFVQALKTTFWVSLMLVLLLYIMSIFCCSQIGAPGKFEGYSEVQDHFDEVVAFNNYQYFGTIPRSMFTLLNVVIGADDWFVISRPLLEKQPVTLFILLMFMLITAIGLMNVITGILCEHVMNSTSQLSADEDCAKKKEVLDKLEGLYDFLLDLDEDGNGKIERWEIEKAWDRPEMAEILSIVCLPLGAEGGDIMDLIDCDGDGALEMVEFVRAIIRLLTNTMFQHTLEIKKQQNRTLRAIREVERRQDRQDETLAKILELLTVGGPAKHIGPNLKKGDDQVLDTPLKMKNYGDLGPAVELPPLDFHGKKGYFEKGSLASTNGHDAKSRTPGMTPSSSESGFGHSNNIKLQTAQGNGLPTPPQISASPLDHTDILNILSLPTSARSASTRSLSR
eukprot:gnl/MRDRNA2_/MRDRNA2_107569_c0_seq1.p1 gnl/MRDRNA2_/MRDRNA2_107569_c0~~gnl/MRDRNA2_/MRDRNA2_107569_c0_seq1.p1  ORF type:complete len:657 (-),score=104.41 gnl/MRDRNA2_/MRDRNA2_107569_c0_seq1:201-1919(-)